MCADAAFGRREWGHWVPGDERGLGWGVSWGEVIPECDGARGPGPLDPGWVLCLMEGWCKEQGQCRTQRAWGQQREQEGPRAVGRHAEHCLHPSRAVFLGGSSHKSQSRVFRNRLCCNPGHRGFRPGASLLRPRQRHLLCKALWGSPIPRTLTPAGSVFQGTARYAMAQAPRPPTGCARLPLLEQPEMWCQQPSLHHLVSWHPNLLFSVLLCFALQRPWALEKYDSTRRCGISVSVHHSQLIVQDVGT